MPAADDGRCRQSSLDANLIDSIDLGRTAFLTAEQNMGFVKDASTKIDNKVSQRSSLRRSRLS